MNRKQNGQAFIIVLIILAVGSLLIVPTLNYVSTGLLGIRVARNSLFTQYALDAAAEYQLWQLDYSDNITELLEQPDKTITVNGIDVEVGLEVPPPPELPETPIVETVGKCLEISLECFALDIEGNPTHWVSLGYEGLITYTLKFYSCGTATIVANTGKAKLPLGFQYVDDSVTTDFPFIINPDNVALFDNDGRQEVVFDLKGAADSGLDRQIPGGTMGGEAPYKYIKFDAVASMDGGIFTAGAVGVAKDQGQKGINDAAPIWSSIYYTKPHAGQTSTSLVIKVNEDGSVEVISYQTQQK